MVIKMNSLMIIDDEQIIIDEFIRAVSFEAIDIKLVGTACNGTAGLEEISKLRPDIIICDINMPGMSGLEMLERVSCIGDYKPQVILLTALNEFSYAQKAIELNVLDYLVKPSTPSDLLKVLEKAKAACKREEQHSLNEGRVADNSKAIFIENVIFCNYYSEKEISEEQRRLGINLNGRYYKLLHVRIGNGFNITTNESEQLKKAVTDCFSGSFKNIYSTMFNSSGIYFLICTDDIASEKTEEKCRDILSKFSGNRIYISVSNHCNNILEIGELLKQVQFCAKFAFCFSEGKILLYDVISEYIKNAFVNNLFAEYEKKLNSIINIKQNPWDEYISELNNINSRFEYYDPEYIKNIIYHTLTKLINNFYNIENDDELEKKSTMWIDISGKEFFSDIVEYCRGIISEMKKYVKANVFERQTILAEKIKKYIEENYMYHITIESVAKEFYISQSGLRRLFLSTNKSSFNDYLIAFRMNKAHELLQLGRYKIYEVAQMVGYRDVPSFRKIFSKYFGMTPSELK
ncbi:MAG: response regulator [Clostridia bacterium]|nr:response regulator [Clostridia bacterium]